jgi:hypothetical protein
MLATAYLNETYTTPPRVHDETPIQRATGYKLFDWYNLPENKEKGEVRTRVRRCLPRLDYLYSGSIVPWLA